ncbi:MAG TPA: carboxypeptidase-like regulatory domain-containing protein [Chitinophagaceae bacterium]|nr:carboxypeptidase-like regulatory domain-containing protein [Chitinophagaceae bacterium]
MFIFGAVKKVAQYLIILLFFIPAISKAQFENVRDSVVQLYGIVMTADSLVGIPAVSVVIKGQNRGTLTNNEGVFSIVVLKGDVIEFTHVSYKPKIVTIPKNLEGNQYSVVQLMIADTVYLPATIIRPRPTAAQFARDFANTKVADDDLEIARRNTSVAQRRALAKTLPSDGREASAIQLKNVATRATYTGQVPPQNIFNPAAWVEFIEAWKRGDFKKKN